MNQPTATDNTEQSRFAGAMRRKMPHGLAGRTDEEICATFRGTLIGDVTLFAMAWHDLVQAIFRCLVGDKRV